ncbi:armadillo-type protein [Gorgonomyces haynaldii]|nr:armadillo-type protein [Gorgonomyces haynaldii]
MFDSIRKQANSGLENQKSIAMLLLAVESSLKEQSLELEPLNYFKSFMSLLEQQIDQGNGELLASVVYLLQLCLGQVNPTLLRLKMGEIGVLFVTVLEKYNDNAPLIRSTLGSIETLLFVQDSQQWHNDHVKQLYQFLLKYGSDPRPKVRKRANEACRKLIDNPPPPSFCHPFCSRTVDFCNNALKTYLQSKDHDQQMLHVLVFLKLMIPVFGKQSNNERVSQSLQKLLHTLLQLPVKSTSSGTVLTEWVFQVLDGMVSDKWIDAPLIDGVIKSLLKLAPHLNDAVLCPPWLSLMTKLFQHLSQLVLQYETGKMDYVDPSFEKLMQEYPKMLNQFFSKIFGVYDLTRDTKAVILQKATNVLSSLFFHSVSNAMVQDAMMQEGPLVEMIALVLGSLTNIRYRDNWGYILAVSGSLVQRLVDAPELSFALLDAMLAFRDDKAYNSSFPFKQELDQALCCCVQVYGIQHFSERVPLNIMNEYPDQPRRPYLIALFGISLQQPSQISPWSMQRGVIFSKHSLDYFVNDLSPLSERMFSKANALWTDNKQLEAKLYETLALQIWDLFPSYCASLPQDVQQAFPALAPVLGKILQTPPEELFGKLPSNPDLRPLVCDGLQFLVNGYKQLTELSPEEGDDDETIQHKANGRTMGELTIEKLQTYVNRFLGALCNNYTTPNSSFLEQKTFQTLFEKEIQHYEKPIRAFLSIAPPEAVDAYFINLLQTLEANIHAEEELEKLRVYLIMDLCLILLPFLSPEGPKDQFYHLLLNSLTQQDPTILKKTYKSLNRVLEHTQVNVQELAQKLIDEKVVQQLSSGTSKARMQLITRVLEMMDDQDMILRFIPSCLPEVMITTKEASEKSRDAAYQTLVAMGYKMKQGSTEMQIEQLNLEGRQRSLREFLLMIIAGLGGSTSSMQSASISSLSRMLFEFHDLIDAQLTKELLETVLITMRSKYTEVIKAAIGFVKVAIVCLPLHALEQVLGLIVTNVMEHSRDHKTKFKSKVRHIIERLIRKFSYEQVSEFVPQQDEKLIINIKKRKERLKRKNVNQKEKEALTFDDALHGSESDIGTDEEYIPDEFKDQVVEKTLQIREDDIVDFLDNNVVSQVTQSKPRKPRQTLPESQGKLLIRDSSDEEEQVEEKKEDYYKQSLESEVAFTRKADGTIKFDKRKQRDEEEEVGKRWYQKEKKQKGLSKEDKDKMLGRQYKAKKAGGDVLRKGMPNPHAYIPLSAQVVGNMHKTAKLDGTVTNILKAAHKGKETAQRQKVRSMKKGNKKHK